MGYLSYKAPAEYIAEANNRRDIINNEVRRHQQQYQQRQKKSHDKGRDDNVVYEVGDAVLINIERRVVGNKKSLRPKWIGPFEVMGVIGGDDGEQYVLREIGNEANERKENVHFLKKYVLAPYVCVMIRCGNQRIEDRSDKSIHDVKDWIFKQCKQYQTGLR